MNKPTCWFFGDSFTQMVVLEQEGEYYKYFGKTAESWTKKICKYYDGVEKNFGFGGKSNQRIIDDAYNEFTNIQNQDLVFLGSTSSLRIEGVNFYHNRMTSYNAELLSSAGGFNVKDDDGLYDVAIHEKDSPILADYLYTFVLEPIDVWNKYWDERFLVLKKNIESRGAKVVYWSNRLWSKFSTIASETNGKSEDDHWGRVGNEQFYSYLIENIKKGNTELGLE